MRGAALTLGLLLFSAPLLAAGEEQFDTTAAKSSGSLAPAGFSARDQSLGLATVATGSGPSAFLVNPALLVSVGNGVSLYQSNNVFFNQSMLSGSFQAPGWGSLGASVAYADFGSVDGSDAQGAFYSVRPYETTLGLGWAKPFGQGMNAGLALNGLYESFGSQGQKASYGGSLGASYERGLFIVAVDQDLASSLDQDALVSTLKLGAAVRGEWMRAESAQLSAQFDHDYGNVRTGRVGLENLSYGILALRVGAESGVGIFSPKVTYGLGLHYKQWQLDISYGKSDDFDASQSASLSWAP